MLSARRRAISGVMGWRDRDSSEGRFFLATFLLVGRHDRTRLYTRRRTARTEDSGRGRGGWRRGCDMQPDFESIGEGSGSHLHGDASSCRRRQPAIFGLHAKQECIPVSFSSKYRTSPSRLKPIRSGCV